jgi:hypothetical protein
MNVSSISYGCCKSRSGAAYVAMVVHVCCKRLFLMFHLFFRRMLQACLSGCCNMFHTYVASVLFGCCVCLQWFSRVFQVFLQVFRMHISSVLSIFFLYVASVTSECFNSRSRYCTWYERRKQEGREQSPHVVWWCKRRPKRRWHATRALACKSDVGRSLARCMGIVQH